jgi:hypothetical protein
MLRKGVGSPVGQGERPIIDYEVLNAGTKLVLRLTAEHL